MIHHPLDPHHTLRAAETAIGGCGLGVGLQAVRGNAHGGDEIGVVGVEHGAVGDRQREILRPAAAAELVELHRHQLALGIHTGAVVDAEVMALAGDHHVVVAVVAHLCGSSGEAGDDGAGAGEGVALAFLAAEAAAHAADLDTHGVHRHAERLGHLVLDLGGVLGGRMHHHVAPLLRQGEGGLAFEVEMLLPAKLDRAFDRGGSLCPACGKVAARVFAGAVLEAGIGGHGIVDGQQGRFFCVGDGCEPGGLACGEVAGGDDEKDRLADVIDFAFGEQGLVVGGGAHVIGGGQVVRRQHGDDAGGGTDGCKVERGDAGAGMGGGAKGEVERVGGRRDVIDVAGLARDVEGSSIMREGFGDAHGCTSRTEVAVPVLSSQ